MSASAALVVLMTTISFADGTLPEIQVYEEASGLRPGCSQGDERRSAGVGSPGQVYAASCVSIGVPHRRVAMQSADTEKH
jgi:hypothetical protein